MSVKDAIPVIFSAQVLQELRNEMTFGKIATKQYTGEIEGKGSRVKVKGWGEVTISDYDPTVGVTYQKPKAAGMYMDIDQAKDYAVEIPDIDEFRSDPKCRKHYAESAGFGLKDEVDTYIAGLYNQCATGAATVTDPTCDTASVVSRMGELWDAGKRANIKRMWAVIPFWVALKLNLAGLVHADDLKGTLPNQFIGKVLNLDLYMSNNCYNINGEPKRHAIMAGSYNAIAFCDQITESETLRLEKFFSDGIRGLHCWGAKVMKPKELFYADLKFADETVI